jgi:hypothetical protein
MRTHLPLVTQGVHRSGTGWRPRTAPPPRDAGKKNAPRPKSGRIVGTTQFPRVINNRPPDSFAEPRQEVRVAYSATAAQPGG